MNSRQEKLEAFGRLLDIMDELREKCPWDHKQTNESLRANTIEETYELAEAIINDDNNEIKKELGDLLLHIVFYSKIGEEKEAFDVAYEWNKKNSDEIQWGIMKKMLDEERAAFQPEDWNKQATMSGMLSRVGILEGFPKIMKPNPAYWDKSKPKSDIQLINFRMITNKNFLGKRTQEYLKANSISYHCARFEESLDVEFVKSLLPLINK